MRPHAPDGQRAQGACRLFIAVWPHTARYIWVIRKGSQECCPVWGVCNRLSGFLARDEGHYPGSSRKHTAFPLDVRCPIGVHGSRPSSAHKRWSGSGGDRVWRSPMSPAPARLDSPRDTGVRSSCARWWRLNTSPVPMEIVHNKGMAVLASVCMLTQVRMI